MTPEELEHRIRAGIPIAGHMDFHVAELSDNTIRVSGGGDENINVHGTAFAGSLYAVCTLALWGLVNSRLPANASLVMVEGSIKYLKPVIGDIVATCEVPTTQMDEFLRRVQAAGKGRLEARVTVSAGERIAVEFSATVYARLQK